MALDLKALARRPVSAHCSVTFFTCTQTNPLRVRITPFFVTDVSNFIMVEELENEVSVPAWTAYIQVVLRFWTKEYVCFPSICCISWYRVSVGRSRDIPDLTGNIIKESSQYPIAQSSFVDVWKCIACIHPPSLLEVSSPIVPRAAFVMGCSLSGISRTILGCGEMSET